MKGLKLYSLIFLCLISKNLFAQNLVLNGSFSDVNTCTEMHARCSPRAWRTTLSNNWQFNSKLQNYYTYFKVFDSNRPDTRTYLESRLGDTLIIGEKYHFSMDICPNGLAINSIGVLLSDTAIYTNSDVLLNLKPNIEFVDNSILLYNNNGGWLHFEKEFVAQNKSLYIIIGNFTKGDSLKMKNVQIKNKSIGYNNYLIDNVQLISESNLHKISDIERVKKIMYSRNKRHPGPDLHIDFNDLLKTKEEKIIKTETIVLYNDLLFKSNSFEPSQYLIEKVDSILHNIKDKTDSVIVTGYTDNIGSTNHNNELSYKRAETVAKYIIKTGILPDAKIVYCGKGSNFPVSTNETETGRYQNRRVEIMVVDK